MHFIYVINWRERGMDGNGSSQDWKMIAISSLFDFFVPSLSGCAPHDFQSEERDE